MAVPISHALVLPDADFNLWLSAADAYLKTFERVVVVRSPEGANLNRFRDVTAVQAPGVWKNNDAVAHLRERYRVIVRVDVVKANKPADMAKVFDARIKKKDRYGETLNSDKHIDDRFVIGYPCDFRPARIVRDFNEDYNGRRHEGLDFAAAKDTGVRAVTGGTVTRINTSADYGTHVQIATFFGSQQYTLTYGFLKDVTVKLGQIVKAGDRIAKANGSEVKLIVQENGRGLAGYKLPNVIDPTNLIHWEGMRLKPTVDGLRIREEPNVNATAKGQVYTTDELEVLERHGQILRKLGNTDRWVKVFTSRSLEGYTAAWFVEAVTASQEPPIPTNLTMTGINLDFTHRLGKPAPERMKGLSWTRFVYNISRGTGSTDIEAAERLYRPIIEAYVKAGLRIILILGHQTYGEGGRFNLNNMSSEAWRQYISEFANMCREVAKRYAGRNLIGAYQIWNEQDTQPGSGSIAAVPLSANIYANMLTETIRAIRAVDNKTPIITGGHISGAGAGVQYAKATLAAMPSGVRPTGIAIHAYGLGAPGSSARYAPFGAIGTTVRAYLDVMNAPLWITEWGVLDLPNDPAADVARYATSFIANLKRYYPDKIAVAVWYAWADGMHNGYGLVDKNDKPKEPLYSEYLKA